MAKKITLETLIKAAPLDESTRKGLLERLPNLTPDEKYKVESILWTRIALLFSAELQKKINEATLAEVKGTRKLTGNDFAEMELIVTRQFAEKLTTRTGLAVRLWDERLTTVQAERVLKESGVSRLKRRGVVDRLAAVILLESYLAVQHTNINHLSQPAPVTLPPDGTVATMAALSSGPSRTLTLPGATEAHENGCVPCAHAAPA